VTTITIPYLVISVVGEGLGVILVAPQRGSAAPA
jgi:hypothetical protein